MNATVNHVLKDVQALARDFASPAHPTSWIEYGTQALKFFGALRALELGPVESLLGRVGLGKRDATIGPVIWLAAGAVVGGGVALAMAPMSGKKLRRRIARFIDSGTTEIESDVKELEARVDGGKKRMAAKSNGAGRHSTT
jgi:hypothetical protein